ncbi:MAG: hypothetical protein U0271_33350 [Polyangiaceae bacterium]
MSITIKNPPASVPETIPENVTPARAVVLAPRGKPTPSNTGKYAVFQFVRYLEMRGSGWGDHRPLDGLKVEVSSVDGKPAEGVSATTSGEGTLTFPATSPFTMKLLGNALDVSFVAPSSDDHANRMRALGYAYQKDKALDILAFQQWAEVAPTGLMDGDTQTALKDAYDQLVRSFPVPQTRK